MAPKPDPIIGYDPQLGVYVTQSGRSITKGDPLYPGAPVPGLRAPTPSPDAIDRILLQDLKGRPPQPTSKPRTRAKPKPVPKPKAKAKPVATRPRGNPPPAPVTVPSSAAPPTQFSAPGSGLPPPLFLDQATPQQLAAAARRAANAALAPSVAALETQRGRTNREFDQQGASSAGAYEALAKLQAGLAPATEGIYDRAEGASASFAAGYSEAFKAASEGTAADMNEFLAQQGSPQQVTSAGAAGADVLYGLGGAIPASTLNREGAAFTAAAEREPGITRQLGLEANRTLEQQRADALEDLMASRHEIDAQRPGIEMEALTGLREQQTQQQALAMNAHILGIETGQKAQAAQDKQTQQQFNNRLRLADLFGFDVLSGMPTVEQRRLAQQEQKWQKRNKTGGFTKKQIADMRGTAATIAESAYTGFVDDQGMQHPALGYQRALQELFKEGVPLAIAQQALNKLYQRGERGRPWLSFQQRQALKAAGLPVDPEAGVGRLSARQRAALTKAGLPGIR